MKSYKLLAVATGTLSGLIRFLPLLAGTALLVSASLGCSFWFFFSFLDSGLPDQSTVSVFGSDIPLLPLIAGAVGCGAQLFVYSFTANIEHLKGMAFKGVIVFISMLTISLSMFSTYSTLISFLETKSTNIGYTDFVVNERRKIITSRNSDISTMSDSAKQAVGDGYRSQSKGLTSSNEKLRSQQIQELESLSEEASNRASPLDGLIRVVGDDKIVSVVFCAWLAITFDLLPILGIALISRLQRQASYESRKAEVRRKENASKSKDEALEPHMSSLSGKENENYKGEKETGTPSLADIPLVSDDGGARVSASSQVVEEESDQNKALPNQDSKLCEGVPLGGREKEIQGIPVDQALESNSGSGVSLHQRVVVESIRIAEKKRVRVSNGSTTLPESSKPRGVDAGLVLEDIDKEPKSVGERGKGGDLYIEPERRRDVSNGSTDGDTLVPKRDMRKGITEMLAAVPNVDARVSPSKGGGVVEGVHRIERYLADEYSALDPSDRPKTVTYPVVTRLIGLGRLMPRYSAYMEFTGTKKWGAQSYFKKAVTNGFLVNKTAESEKAGYEFSKQVRYQINRDVDIEKMVNESAEW